jgi:hypothetical protein
MTMGLILAEPQIRDGKLKALAVLDTSAIRTCPTCRTVASSWAAPTW